MRPIMVRSAGAVGVQPDPTYGQTGDWGPPPDDAALAGSPWHVHDRLARLQSVTAHLAKALDVRDVAAVAVGDMFDALGASACVAYVLGADGRTIEFAAARGVPRETIDTWSTL